MNLNQHKPVKMQELMDSKICQKPTYATRLNFSSTNVQSDLHNWCFHLQGPLDNVNFSR